MSEYNPGISDLVLRLQGVGFSTTDSGDGVTNVGKIDGALPYKHIFIQSAEPVADANLLRGFLHTWAYRLVPQGHGGGWSIQATFDPVDQSGVVMLMEEA